MIVKNIKIRCKILFGATLFLPLFIQATESDFAEAKAFVEKVYLQKGASVVETPHSKKYIYLSTENSITEYTSYVNSYAQIYFLNSWHSSGSFSFNEKSTIVFDRNENNEIVKMTVHGIEAYDCEEEGCSEEGPVVHEFSAEQISSQSYYMNSEYGYDLITTYYKI